MTEAEPERKLTGGCSPFLTPRSSIRTFRPMRLARLVSFRTTWKVAVGVALVGAAAGFLSGPGADADETPASAHAAAHRPRGRSFPGLDPRHIRFEDGAAVADLTDGSTAVLSIDPGLQAHVAH